jgi:hypothetical protein
MDERTQRISLRAYELWEKRGREHGSHLDDWIEAEREIDAEIAGETDAETARGTDTEIASETAPAPRARAARVARAK